MKNGSSLLSTRNCRPQNHSSSNPFDLDYELFVPADCPVPIGSSGETKRLGAYIYDKGTRNVTHAHELVLNSDVPAKIVGGNQAEFGVDESGRYRALLTARYQVATGKGGVIDGNYDLGRFYANNDPDTFSPTGDPFGEVKITYVKSSMTSSIAGTEVPLSNTSYTWTAQVWGGVSPFSYQWYYQGITGWKREFVHDQQRHTRF